jgi:hypothetical protein
MGWALDRLTTLTTDGCAMVVFLAQDQYMQSARYAAAGSVDPSIPFDKVPFRSQVFILETAAALQARDYHDCLYGKSKALADITDAKDFLASWLDHCLANAGLVPQSSDYARPARGSAPARGPLRKPAVPSCGVSQHLMAGGIRSVRRVKRGGQLKRAAPTGRSHAARVPNRTTREFRQ